MKYLERNRFVPRQLTAPIDKATKGIIVIPCFKEEEIILSLEALSTCQPVEGVVEVITVVNYSEEASQSVKDFNRTSFESIQLWIQQNESEWINFHVMQAFELPKKHAGVGLARKIGMDEALDRLNQIDNVNAPIICFDSDSLCQSNYIQEVISYFEKNIKSPGCSIHYEHPIEGTDYDENIYKGIVYYELFLRYYNQGLRLARYPFAYHTIGSSMAVRAEVYAKQGGMNRRKAGEDFYFLHKIMPLGNFGEITTTAVIPSPRTSDRVPFGTGKAISKWVDEQQEVWLTYDPKTFEVVAKVVELIEKLLEIDSEGIELFLMKLDEKVGAFLINDGFIKEVERAKKNSTNAATFKGQFYSYFNGLKLLKLVHFIKDNVFKEVPVIKASKELLSMQKIDFKGGEKDLLKLYRNLDKGIKN